MPKKRLIFTLLYDKGHFMLSRNFRLQRVGNSNWINRNYKFSTIAKSIDELIILNVSRDDCDMQKFLHDVQEVSQGCFVPLALGGSVRNLEHVALLMANGADKIVLNTPLFDDPTFVQSVVKRYGNQCVVGSIDYRETKSGGYDIYTANGSRKVDLPISEIFDHIASLGVGEIYLNSMDGDGTGQGYRLGILQQTKAFNELPIILAGGAGNFKHLLEGLQREDVDAVATANLFNFVGNGLPSARTSLLEAGMDLARW